MCFNGDINRGSHPLLNGRYILRNAVLGVFVVYIDIDPLVELDYSAWLLSVVESGKMEADAGEMGQAAF